MILNMLEKHQTSDTLHKLKETVRHAEKQTRRPSGPSSQRKDTIQQMVFRPCVENVTHTMKPLALLYTLWRTWKKMLGCVP